MSGTYENGREREPTKSNGTDVMRPNAEPSELDPCMNDSKDKKHPNFFRRYRDEISLKSGLSHKGVYVVGGIVILALLLLIVVISLAAAWPRIPHRYQFPVCDTVECLRSSAQIRESLDDTVSPCDDLWTAVCRNWLKKYPLPRDKNIWNQKRQLMRREAEGVQRLIATFQLPLHLSTVEYKMKYLYESCLDVDNVDVDRAVLLKRIITKLGGWYILRDWNEVDFDQNKLLQKLHVDYGVSPFFKISVEPNPNMPGHYAIRISPSGLSLLDKEYYYREEDERIQTAFKEYVTDIIIDMGSTRKDAAKFGTDIFSYEKRIAEITPDTISLQNPITTYNAISLSELKDTNLIPFFDIILAMYPKSNITENTEVIVTSMEYLSQIAAIMASTDRKTMNGYLIWTLVRNYIPYLAGTFMSTLHTFNSELYGIQKPSERWEMCAELVIKFMGLAVDSLVSRENPVTKNEEKVINDTFTSVVDVVKKKVGYVQESSLLYNHLELKLSSIRLQIGVPEFVTKDAFLKDYYTLLTIYKTSFFESVENAIVLQREMERRSLDKHPYDDVEQWYSVEEEPKVKYSPSDHAVIIPRSILTEPLFQEEYARAIIYGRLGVEIAEAVVSSVFPYGSLWTSNRKILSPYHMTVNDSLKAVQRSQKCLGNYILNLNLSIPNITVNETALNILKHLSAVDVAKEALLTELEKAEHVHQPTLENYDDQALFFLAYSQTQCSDSTSQYQLYQDILHFELPQRSRLYLTWTQLPDFAESFECSFNKKLQCPHIF